MFEDVLCLKGKEQELKMLKDKKKLTVRLGYTQETLNTMIILSLKWNK